MANIQLTDDNIVAYLRSKAEDPNENVITYPAYANAFAGVSSDGRAIYDFFKMMVVYAAAHQVTLDEAEEGVRAELKSFEASVNELKVKGPIVNMGNPFDGE